MAKSACKSFGYKSDSLIRALFWRFFAILERIKELFYLYDYKYALMYLEENFTDYNSYYDVEDMIEKNALINRTQRKITGFFE